MKSLPFIVFIFLTFSCLNSIYANDSLTSIGNFSYERMTDEEKLVSSWTVGDFLKQFGLPYSETYISDEATGKSHRVIYPSSIFKNDSAKPSSGLVTIIFGPNGKAWRIYRGDLTTVYIRAN